MGRGIKNDLKRLQTEGNIKDSFTSFVELAPLAKKCHIAPNARVSLTELSALVLGSKLNKDDAIRVSTEWENINLSQDQIMYIAQDAHASKCIYEKLVQLEKYGNVPQNATPGLPVIIYQEDGQKTIAYGAWSSLNTEENAVVDDIALHTSDKLVAIEIQKVSVPGAIIESHKKKALKDFGPPPFVLVCNRKQVHVSVIQEIESDEVVHETVGSDIPMNAMQLDAVNPNSTVDTWTDEADLEVHPNSLPETPAQNLEHDPVSTQIGHETLAGLRNSMTSPGPICSRVLLDPWHIFDRISIPKTHGLRLQFARAMRDAIFLINKEDRALVEA